MLTKRQKQILDYIQKFIEKKGYSPSFEKVAKHFKLVKSTIHQHIETLKSKGYLKNQPRIIEISKNKKFQELVQIPILGTIAAGQPIEIIRDKEFIKVAKSRLSSSGEHYALKVQGDSMIDEGIHDSDVVIIKKQSYAEDGETIVALTNYDEVTLKKIYKEKDGFRLQPANPKLKPIFVKELIIQGKVISVIKNYKELKEKIKAKLKVKIRTSKTPKKNIKKHLNKVFLGDIMNLLKELPNESVDMVFGDPDYNVGIKYRDKSYTRNFNEYIEWYIDLIKESMRVLRKDGNLFTMNYPKQNAHLRVKYLDNTYPLIHEYVWTYNTNVGHSSKRFTTGHRNILHVRKSKNNKFYKNNVALPYKNPTDRRILKNLRNGSKGRMPYSWFYFNLVKNVSKEKTCHACQIPQKLTEMLIKSCTMPNDMVLILFGGSGAELEVCKRTKRQYISAEIDEKYYEMIKDRLKNGCIKKEYKLKLRNPIKPKESLSLFSKEV